MKKLLIAIASITLMTCNYALAIEKKELKDVDSNTFIEDTQAPALNTGDEHIALVWWIPQEYWQSIMARDTTTSEVDKEAILETMSDVSLLAVLQADISNFGSLNFYGKEEVEENMQITFVDANGKTQNLAPLTTIDSELEIMLSVMKPILESALGNFGKNFHFYVLSDQVNSISRVTDPYEKGNINVQLLSKDNKPMEANIELPLNSLFVPRKCPNGKDAHVTWNYCPWSGEKLGE